MSSIQTDISQHQDVGHFGSAGVWLHPVGVFLLCLATYSLTLPRTITLEDAGLFQMVCHLGGLSHPPGYPLFTNLCQAFVELPFFTNEGRSVVAGNLLSAIFAAAAVSILHHICFLYRDRRFAWIASMGYGLSAAFWSQAIIIEVYSLAVLTFMICWLCSERFVRSGNIVNFYLLGFFYGLALSNHWPLIVLSTPALIFLIWQRIDQLLDCFLKPSFWLLSILALGLGLTPYLSLFVVDPVIGVYGGIDSIESLTRYVMRSMYSDVQEVATISDKFAFGGWILKTSLMQFGLWAAPIIVIGVWWSTRIFPQVFVWFLWLTYLGSTYLLLTMISFDYDYLYQAIYKPYPVIAYSAVAVWFAAGIDASLTFLSKRTQKFSVLIPVLAIALTGVSNVNENNRRADLFSDHYARILLNILPPESVLFVYGDFETALFGYLVKVEGVRRDVELREWEQLVFSNRFVSPFSSDAEKETATMNFINSTDKPVFSIDKRLTPFTDYGLVYQLNRNQADEYVLTPEVDKFTQHLINLYLGSEISDPHQRVLAMQLLLRLSRLYFGYSLESESKWLQVTPRIEELQKTFPGRLVTLETMLLRNKVTPVNRPVLLEIATAAETDIPDEASSKSVAILYEYIGRLLSYEQSDAKQAFTYFEKSIVTYPTADNTSICPRRKLSEALGLPISPDLQFEDVICENARTDRLQ